MDTLHEVKLCKLTYLNVNTNRIFLSYQKDISLLKFSLKIFVILKISTDEPDGTGDHENYKLGKSVTVFELDGKKYSKCEQKGQHIRSVQTHISWHNLNQRFIYSKNGKYFKNLKPSQIKFRKSLDASHG